MKKILALIMVLALSLSFASCKKENADASSITSNQTQGETSSIENRPEKPLPVVSDIEQPTTSQEVNDTSNKTEKPTSSEQEKPETTTSKPAVVTPSKPAATPSKPQTTTSKPQTTTSKPAATVSKPATPNPTTNVFFNDQNNAFDVNALSIKPRYVYWKDGDLYAECFVINGYSHNVFNIDVKSITISNKSGVIAEGTDFGKLNGITLAPRTHVVWGFKFTGDAVKKYGADLSTLTCNARVSNNY